MAARAFLDTNVLVYADDQDAGEKRTKAIALLETCFQGRAGVLSTQTLQEYFVTATKKLGVEVAVARRKLELFARLDVVVIEVEDVLGAVDLARLHRLSFWDALIVRAALQSSCSVLYTEDLQHGRRIDGLHVVDPFR